MTRDPIRVLTIEDELGMRQLLTYELSAKGYLVETACDGIDGLTMLKERHYDAVITDLRMPRLGGLDTLRSIKTSSPDTHVILISAHGTIETAVTAMKQGALDFVQKPFDVDHIARLIETAVKRRRLEALGAVHQAARQLAQEVGNGEVLELICGLVVRQLQASRVALFVERGGDLALEAQSADEPRGAAWRDWALKIAKQAAMPPASWTYKAAPFAGCRSAAAAALPGKPGGALVVARPSPEEFTAAELRLVDLFAAQLSLALRAQKTSKALAQTEASLVRAEGLGSIATVAAGVAHEIGNALSCLLGYTQFMHEENDLSPGQAEALSVMERQIRRCAVLCEDLRNLGRRREAAPSRFRLSEPLQAALRLARFELSAANVKVSGPKDEGPLVEGDPSELQQLFLNLIRNAVSAMEDSPRDRKLEAWVGTREGRAVVRIGDNGPGISPEVRGRLFEPFFTTKGRSGTGLGLYLCASIARRCGGSLLLEDVAGGGALAILELPLAAGVQPA